MWKFDLPEIQVIESPNCIDFQMELESQIQQLNQIRYLQIDSDNSDAITHAKKHHFVKHVGNPS